MNPFEFEYEINDALSYLKKGHTPIQVRRLIIEKGFAKETATQISKEAFRRFIESNAIIKTKKGLFWFIGSFITLLILLYFKNAYSYATSFGTIWGLYNLFSGISDKRSIKQMKVFNI